MNLTTFYVDKSKCKYVPIHPIKAYNFGGTAPITLNLDALPLAQEPAVFF